MEEPTSRYVQMIVDASTQLTEILDVLGLAARIEGERYEPNAQEIETGELVAAAAARVEHAVAQDGESAAVHVDVDAAERAVADLAVCARRHGGLDSVEIAPSGGSIVIRPITPAAAPIVLGEDLRDLGAAIAGRTIRALGGDLTVEGEELRVLLPSATPAA